MAPEKRKRRQGKTKVRKGDDESFDAGLAKALSHPLRVDILRILNEQVLSPKLLSVSMGEPLGNISYHVRVLHEYDCIELVKKVPVRGATEHFYRGVNRSFLNDENWATLSPEVKTGISVAGMKMISGAAKLSLEAGLFDARADRHLSCTPVDLDQEGWEDTMTLLNDTLDRVIEIHGESADRRSQSNERSVPATISLLGFESPSNRPANPPGDVDATTH